MVASSASILQYKVRCVNLIGRRWRTNQITNTPTYHFCVTKQPGKLCLQSRLFTDCTAWIPTQFLQSAGLDQSMVDRRQLRSEARCQLQENTLERHPEHVRVIIGSFSCSPSSLIRFTSLNLNCISKSMKHQQTSDWKSDIPWFSKGYRRWVFCKFLNWNT